MKTNNEKHIKVTKNDLLLIKSLKSAHGRKKSQSFIIEGIKNVEDLLDSKITINKLLFSESLPKTKSQFFIKLCYEKNLKFVTLFNNDYKKITTMKSPEGVMAICNYYNEMELENAKLPAIYLSEINDPGNLGTIFRTAAWFRIKSVIISENSVDAFNPKVIRSSMGSFFHLKIIQNVKEENFIEFISTNEIPIYSADLEGKNPVTFYPPEKYIVCFGSESHGVPQIILENSTKILSIPKFGSGESLNLGMSVGIVLNSLINKGL